MTGSNGEGRVNMKKVVLTLMTGSLLAMATACSSTPNNSSGRGGVPDEFRVVKKAPLTVPPEYSLRPPEAGRVRPVEVDPTRQDNVLAFGSDIGLDASPAERILIVRAGAIAVSPIIRETIDYDESGLLRKNLDISDTVTSWTGTDDELAIVGDDNATGGQQVTIERSTGRRIKLPGT